MVQDTARGAAGKENGVRKERFECGVGELRHRGNPEIIRRQSGHYLPHAGRSRFQGVKVQACLACADSYGVTEQLRKLGIEVKYMGKPLTDLITGGWKILTF